MAKMRVHGSRAVSDAPPVVNTAKMRVHGSRGVGTGGVNTAKMRVHGSRAVGTLALEIVPQVTSIAEPGLDFSITSVPKTGTAVPDTYEWRVVSGPAAVIVGNGATARLAVPSAMIAKTMVIGCKARKGALSSPEVFTTLMIPPAPTFAKGPGETTWRPARARRMVTKVPTVSELPNRLPAGLAARSYAMATGAARPYISVMIASDWTWGDLQPSGPDTLSATAMAELVAALDWAWDQRGIDDKPIDVVLRMAGGKDCPVWVKNEVGTYLGYGQDGVDKSDPAKAAPSNANFFPLDKPIPKAWTKAYQARKANFERMMLRPLNRSNLAAGGVAGHPAVVGISNTDPCTQYSEPTVKQYGLRENREAATAAGWTPELDAAAFTASWASLKAATAGLGLFIESAYNKAETIRPDGRYFADPDRAFALMEEQRLTLGAFGMWSNHGLAGGDDTEVFAWMRSGRRNNGTPISFQTRTKGKLDTDFANGQLESTVAGTIAQALAWQASWVEIPMLGWTGSNPLTLEYAQSVQAQFRANNVGLDLTTPPPVTTTGLKPVIGWAYDGLYADPITANSGNPKSMATLPPAWAINNANMRNIFWPVGVSEITNTSVGGTVTYKVGSIEERVADIVAWNNANPTKKITISMRLHVGVRAPAVWRTLCNEVVINNETFGSGGPIPRWWTAAYKELYRQTMVALGPIIDSIDCIGSVNNPMHAMSYPEPFLLYATQDNGNKEALAAAGWTNAAHKTWMRWAASTAMAPITKKIVYLTVNPASWPTDDGTGTGPTQMDFMKELGALHIASRPAGQAGISNYSYATDRVYDPGNYNLMYAWIDELNCWKEVQLARPQRINGNAAGATVRVWDSLADHAFARGYHGVETSGDNADVTYANVFDRSYSGFAAKMASQQATANTIPKPAPVS